MSKLRASQCTVVLYTIIARGFITPGLSCGPATRNKLGPIEKGGSGLSSRTVPPNMFREFPWCLFPAGCLCNDGIQLGGSLETGGEVRLVCNHFCLFDFQNQPKHQTTTSVQHHIEHQSQPHSDSFQTFVTTKTETKPKK